MSDLFQKVKIYGFKKSIEYAINELKLLLVKLIRKSYSQHQEDLVISHLLNNKKNGFYVDIGANDPDRFSNTKKFYKKGWFGINVEPNPVLFKKFATRNNDINLNIGISDKNTILRFYSFIPNTISTFSKDMSLSYQKQGYKLIKKYDVDVMTLEKVFNKNVGDRQIDFLSIDVEGFEMEVLRSNNWKKYKPTIICLESIDHNMDGTGTNNIKQHVNFLHTYNYELVHFNGINSIFKLNRIVE